MSWSRQLGALLVSAMLAATALAQEETEQAPPPREGRPERGEARQQMLERFDADGDGELNDEERAKAREFRQGRKQGGERGEGRRGREGRSPGDRGPEGRGPDGPPPGGPRGPGFPPNPMRLFEAYDEDKNDQLSRDEFEKLMGKLRELGSSGPGRPGPGGPPEFRRRGGPDGPGRDGRPPRPRGEGDRGPEGRRQRPPREEGAEEDEGRQSPEAEAAKADDATV